MNDLLPADSARNHHPYSVLPLTRGGCGYQTSANGVVPLFSQTQGSGIPTGVFSSTVLTCVIPNGVGTYQWQAGLGSSGSTAFVFRLPATVNSVLEVVNGNTNGLSDIFRVCTSSAGLGYGFRFWMSPNGAIDGIIFRSGRSQLGRSPSIEPNDASAPFVAGLGTTGNFYVRLNRCVLTPPVAEPIVTSRRELTFQDGWESSSPESQLQTAGGFN